MPGLQGLKTPARACCHTMDDERICVLMEGHWGEHVYAKQRCNHTPQPEGYREWHSWTKKKIKTHKQVKCPYCGLWSIWIIDTKKSAKSAGSTQRTTKGTVKGASRTANTKRKPAGGCNAGILYRSDEPGKHHELRNIRYF